MGFGSVVGENKCHGFVLLEKKTQDAFFLVLRVVQKASVKNELKVSNITLKVLGLHVH